MPKPRPPLERAARALCRCDGLPENIIFEGRPMWESFIPKANAVLDALEEPVALASRRGRDRGGE